jgi:hypothetical protein
MSGTNREKQRADKRLQRKQGDGVEMVSLPLWPTPDDPQLQGGKQRKRARVGDKQDSTAGTWSSGGGAAISIACQRAMYSWRVLLLRLRRAMMIALTVTGVLRAKNTLMTMVGASPWSGLGRRTR